MIRLVYVTLLTFVFTCAGMAQSESCTISTLGGEPIRIAPVDTVRLRLLVINADKPLLGEGGQGVCGVDLSFQHHDATDLNMTLYSPSIESSILMGPAISNSTMQNLFAGTYDISFIPSTATAIPDSGLTDQWSNNNIDNRASYSGTYYPFGNSLDGGFMGEVEGVWELVIIDQFVNFSNSASFDEFSIQFCDQNLTCSICEAESGTFQRDSINLCQNSNLSTIDVYTPVSDPALYTELPMIFNASTAGSPIFLDDRSLTEGSYELMMVTIHRDQVGDFKSFAKTIAGGPGELMDLANQPGGKYCMDVVGPITVQINSASTNYMTFTPDSIELDCSENGVFIHPIRASIDSGSIVKWEDENGTVISKVVIDNAGDINVALLGIMIYKAGRYIVTIDDGLCVVQNYIDVYHPADIESIGIKVNTISTDCAGKQIVLKPTEVRYDVIYNWWFTRDESDIREHMNGLGDSIFVNAVGTYSLESTKGNCTTVDSIYIDNLDSTSTIFVVVSDSLSCSVDEVKVTISSTQPVKAIKWYDIRNEVFSRDSIVYISRPGFHTVDVTDFNDCQTSLAYEVKGSTMGALLDGVTDTASLTCAMDSIVLDPSNITDSTIVTLNFDGGQLGIISFPYVIKEPGRYVVDTKYGEGCEVRQIMTVVDERSTSSDMPCNVCEAASGSFSRDSISICAGSDFSIADVYTAMSDPMVYADLMVAFDGETPLFLDDQSLPEGMYEIIAITIEQERVTEFKNFASTVMGGPDGFITLAGQAGGQFCIDVAGPISLTVSRSSDSEIRFAADSVMIGCNGAEVSLVAWDSTISRGAQVQWEDEEGNIIGNMTIVTVTEPGRYTFSIDDGSCKIEDYVDVYLYDDVKIDYDQTIIDCDVREVVLRIKDQLDDVDYEWFYASNTTTTSLGQIDFVEVDKIGTYTLRASYLGCTSVDSVVISNLSARPQISVVVSDSLSCAVPEVKVTLSSTEPVTNVVWFDTDGNQIGEDSVITFSEPGVYVAGVNGIISDCNYTQTFEVKGSTMPPPLDGVPTDSIVALTCNVDSFVIDPSNITEATVVTLSFDGGLFDTISFPYVLKNAGTYVVATDYGEECVRSQILTLVDQRDSGDQITLDTTLSCTADSILIDYALSSEEYDFTWSGINLEDVSISAITVSRPGRYVLTAVNKMSGCTNTYIANVGVNRSAPNVIMSGDTSISCINPSATFGVTIEDGERFFWTDENGQSYNTQQITTDVPGTYNITIENEQGCIGNGIWRISDSRDLPAIDIADSYKLTCAVPSLTLEVSNAESIEVIWIFTDGTTTSGPSIEITNGLLDSVRITNTTNGCTNSKPVSVKENKVGPEAKIINGDTTLCHQSDLVLSAVKQNPDVLISWANKDGEVIGSGEDISISTLGTIIMEALDTTNGCTTLDSVSILVTEQPLLGFELMVLDESCVGQNNGTITVLEILGGDGVESFEFNKMITEQSNFNDLKPGEYELRVVDNTGCSYDTTVTVAKGEDISINLGNDLQVNVDQEVTISSNAMGPITNHDWFANGIAQNADLDMLTQTIKSNTEVILQVLSSNGCADSDTLFVSAIVPFSAIDMYIPNAFAPGGSDRNSKFSVSLPESIVSVDKVTIFDRWGGMLIEQTPAQSAFVELWDGRTSSGQLVSPGVYTYVCEVTTTSEGRAKTFVGTVNVFR